MIKIEIASYPKSGNTWFRYIAKDFLSQLSGEDFYLPDNFNKNPQYVRNREGVYIKEINDKVIIYKSHVFNNPRVKPDKVIHIYRHPLDVFLSARNFMFCESGRYRKARLERLYIGGKAKSVEEIYADNEMEHYFSEFLEQAGASYWPGMLGKNSNYFNYVLTAIELDNVVSIRYEDLLQSTSDCANRVFNSIWREIPYISINDDEVNKSTKNSDDKAFYWKSRYKNYENFLSKKQIDAFNKKYKDELRMLNY